MNTSHNKDRILEHGWKNVLRNMINCGKASRSDNGIEIDSKKNNMKPIKPDNESVKLDTKDVYTIQSLKNQKCTDVNNDSINLEPSHSKMLVDKAHSKPTCHQDIELPLLEFEEFQNILSLETLALKLMKDMSNCLEDESGYIDSFKELLRIVDCNKKEVRLSKYELELERSDGYVAKKESIKGKCKKIQKGEQRAKMSAKQESIEKVQCSSVNHIDDKSKTLRMRKRKQLINQIIVLHWNQDKFHFFLNRLIDLEEQFANEE